MKLFLEKEIRKFLIEKLSNIQYSENYECFNHKNEAIQIKNVLPTNEEPYAGTVQWAYEHTRGMERLLDEKISIEEPFIIVVSNIHYYLVVQEFLESNELFKAQGICYLIDDTEFLHKQQAWSTRVWYYVRLVDGFFTQTDFGKISIKVGSF